MAKKYWPSLKKNPISKIQQTPRSRDRANNWQKLPESTDLLDCNLIVHEWVLAAHKMKKYLCSVISEYMFQTMSEYTVS